jgi:hypothetical protein
MTASEEFLHRIENDTKVADLLRWPGGFDIDRRDPVEALQLPNRLPLIPIAGCDAGGTYFLCGAPGAQWHPVLYASSEGQATLMADDLVEVITLIATFPYWQDLGAGFRAEQLEKEVLADHPGFRESRGRLLAALNLDSLPAEEAVARLRAAAARTVPDYIPRTVDGDHPYELLFGDAGNDQPTRGRRT